MRLLLNLRPLLIGACLAMLATNGVAASLTSANPRDQWVSAIKQDNLPQLHALLDGGYTSERGEGGRTALMVAAKYADMGLMRALLDRHADVNERSDTGGTALMFAVLSADADAVAFLLKHNARVSLASRNGWTALILAAAKNRLNMVEQLLVAGANVQYADVYGFNALMRAVENQHHVVTARLLREDALQLEQRDSLGNSALHYAAGLGDTEIIAMLIDAKLKPDKNARGFWPADLLPPTADASLESQLMLSR